MRRVRVIGDGEVAERFRARAGEAPGAIAHLVGWLPGMGREALTAVLTGEALVATPNNLDLPAWDRLVRRYVVSSQRHARLLARAGVALGRLVVVEPGAEAADGTERASGIFVSGPEDGLDGGRLVAAAARGDTIVLTGASACAPDGAIQAEHRGEDVARALSAESREALSAAARAWWAASHRAEHESAGLQAVYAEVAAMRGPIARLGWGAGRGSGARST